MDLLSRLKGILGSYEAAGSIGSGLLAQPAAGMAGLLALPGGPEKAANAVRTTQNALTYQPRTDAGVNALASIGRVMEPVSNALSKVQQATGDAGYAMGGPVGGMLGATLPDAAMMALPAMRKGIFANAKPSQLDPQRGIFAGVGAKTADLAQFEQAQRMAKAGMSADDIWRDTGWFQGADKKWRFEIDDSGATAWGVPNEKASRIETPAKTFARAITQSEDRGLRYKDVVQHPNLYSAYDGFSEKLASVRPLKAGERGQLDPAFGIISLDETLNPTQAKSTALHEMQHAIQGKEGFAKGGSPESMGVEYARAYQKYDFDTTLSALARTAVQDFGGSVDNAAKELNKIGIPVTDDHIQELMRIGEKQAIKRGDDAEKMLSSYGRSRAPNTAVGQDLYRRLAGEVEARAVQSRMNLTPEQRKALPPWQSYDVPVREMIVR